MAASRNLRVLYALKLHDKMPSFISLVPFELTDRKLQSTRWFLSLVEVRFLFLLRDATVVGISRVDQEPFAKCFAAQQHSKTHFVSVDQRQFDGPGETKQ